MKPKWGLGARSEEEARRAVPRRESRVDRVNMNNTLATLLAAASLVVNPGSAYGHHGFAEFDTKTVATLKGTVTDFHFVNPHSIVEFDVKDDKGQVRSWKGELTSPLHLAPLGWTASSLEAGDEITISGFRAKNGAPSLWVTKLVLASGQELKIGSGN